MKQINVYMDLTGAIIEKTGEGWTISTDTGTETFRISEDMMNYISEELDEIRKIYENNGELEDLKQVYKDNGLEA